MQTKFNYDAKGNFIVATDNERLFDKIHFMLTHGWFDASQVGIVRGEGEHDGVYIATDGIEVDVEPEQLAIDLEDQFHGIDGYKEFFVFVDRYGYTYGQLYTENDKLPESQDNVISLGTCCCPEEAHWRARVHDCNVQSRMVGNSPCDDWYIPKEDNK